MPQLRKALFTALAITVLSLCAAQTSYADTVVFDNGAPNGINGRNIGNQFYTTEDFTLSSAQTLTSVRFWGLRTTATPTFSGQVYWELRSNAAGAPGAVLTSGLSPGTEMFRAPSVVAGFSSYQYDFSVGSVNLAAGTYWLVLHNGPFGSSTGNVFWETTAPNSTFFAYQRLGTTDPFIITTPPTNHLAFQINAVDGAAPVPEPTTMLLLGTGLAGVAAKVRRRRRAR